MKKLTLKKLLARSALFGALVLGAGSAVAATDGTLGATSTGNLNVILGVPDMVKITKLNDINLGTYAGVNMVGSDDVCVYHNGASTYNITISGTGPANALQLKNGSATATIPFTATYFDGVSTSAVVPAVALTNRQNASTTSMSCSGGTNASMNVSVQSVDIESAPVDTYTETVTMTVAPF